MRVLKQKIVTISLTLNTINSDWSSCEGSGGGDCDEVAVTPPTALISHSFIALPAFSKASVWDPAIKLGHGCVCAVWVTLGLIRCENSKL